MRGFPLLEVTEAVENLAAQFMLKSNLPTKASDDAIHIARFDRQQSRLPVNVEL